MIVQDSKILVSIITKIEKIISDLKDQHPNLSDEEIFERLKIILKH